MAKQTQSFNAEIKQLRATEIMLAGPRITTALLDQKRIDPGAARLLMLSWLITE